MPIHDHCQWDLTPGLLLRWAGGRARGKKWGALELHVGDCCVGLTERSIKDMRKVYKEA
jgi:hypothetical protein